MATNQNIQSLFNKYIQNECSPEEFQKLMDLVKTDPGDQRFEEPLKSLWEQTATTSLNHEIDWEKIHNHVTQRRNVPFWSNVHFKYAAILSFCLLSFYLLFQDNPKNIFSKDQAVYLTKNSATEHATGVILADGTKVTLNSNSNLRYPEKFGAATREVYLKGEAYFQVAHNKNKPFIVHSGKLKTQVLGTTFVVSAYATTIPLRVTVLTGKVVVKDETTKARVVLTRGQVASIHQNKQAFLLTHMADPEEAIAWTEGKLIFDNATLEETAFKLSNRYGIKIIITDQKVSEQRITAMFQQQSLTKILNALTRLTHSNYKKENNNYIIY
jgi:transmembrane sensor